MPEERVPSPPQEKRMYMTMSALRRRVIGTAGAVAAATMVTATLLTVSPANATLPDTGGDCSDSHSWSVPSAGKLTVTFKIKCTYDKWEMYHGLTISRSGASASTGGGYCTTRDAIRTCTKSITVNDPAGVQNWTLGDEWSTRESPTDSWSRDYLYVAPFSH
jgi:hypothetical protein